jgi:site-specific DNA recombinase
VKDGVRSRLEVCPVDGPIAARVFELAGEGLGAQAIALKMNEAGLLRAGKRWTKNTVNYTLKSETYTGVRTFNKTNRRARKAKPRSEWIQVASHPPIVDRETFERIQTMLEERAPQYERGGTPRSTFIFTGLVTCGICSVRCKFAPARAAPAPFTATTGAWRTAAASHGACCARRARISSTTGCSARSWRT